MGDWNSLVLERLAAWLAMSQPFGLTNPNARTPRAITLIKSRNTNSPAFKGVGCVCSLYSQKEKPMPN